MASWRDNIELVENGESVEEQTPNRPLQQLAERTQYLKDRLDAAASGEGLTLFSQVIDSKVELGDAVYYDNATDSFKRALATTGAEEDGTLRTGDEAFVVGVVIRKLSTTTADIGISGRFTNVTLKDAAGVALPDDRYYLSGSDRGKLVSRRPAVGIFVCTVTDQGVIVNPTPREVLEDHLHYRIELVAEPAGTAVCRFDDRVNIEYADEDKRGWLPADANVFQDAAPAGARFGYNWMRDSALAAVWPPQPLGSAYLELDGKGVAPEHVLVNDDGIWWLTNCRADVPWDPTTCNSSSIPASVERSSSTQLEAPYQPCDATARRVTLWFTKMVSKTDQAAVTGLKAVADSPIVVTACTAKDASDYCQGRVSLDLDIPWTRTAGTSGSEVVKGVTGQGELAVGQVVEGLTGAGLISLTGTQKLGSGHFAGLVTVTGVDPTAVTRTLDVQLVALSGATEGIYSGVLPFVGLPSGRATSFVGKVRVPQLAETMTRPKLDINLWVALPTAGTPPANVTLCYAEMESAETFLEGSSSSMTRTFGNALRFMPTEFSTPGELNLDDAGALLAGNYFNKMALSVDITSESVLLFKLARSASDGYAGELAIINMAAKVYDAG